uniref:GLOBIN domain-containing protein n=1 Tax=Caenorhabditis japonica TaxID=281687 RepID=A0A8R1DQM4_CAEJA
MESLEHLTPTDREILNKSWAIVSKDMQQVAVNIFQMIFEQAPDAKLMFSFMMKDYKEDKKSNEFIFHAVRFLQVIESTMTHLENPSQLDAVFLNLGKIHARHEEQLGFSAHYWSVFKECVLFHFRRAMKANNKFLKRNEMPFAEIDSAIILWREVLRFIIDRMKVGYSATGAIRKANKQAIHHDHSISPDDSGLSSGQSVETKQDLTQALRRRELSIIVPEYFICRRKSEADASEASSPS